MGSPALAASVRSTASMPEAHLGDALCSELGVQVPVVLVSWVLYVDDGRVLAHVLYVQTQQLVPAWLWGPELDQAMCTQLSGFSGQGQWLASA